MRWRKRYERLEPIATGSKSFHGREATSQKPVVLHLLPDDAKLREILGLPATALEHVWDVWEFEGSIYVVTDAAFGEVDLERWTACAHGGTQEPAGEFTRVFQTVNSGPPRSAEPTDTGGGEFTQLFQASPERPGPLASPKAAEASEFTRFLSAASVPERPKAAAETPAGELTNLFRRGPQRPDRPPPVIPVRVAGRSETPPREPVREIPREPAREAGEFTRLLRASLIEPASKANAGAMSNEPKSAPLAIPGEYTRMVSTPRAPKPVPAETAETKPAPDSKGRWLAPVLVFSGLAALAVVLILVFAIFR